MNWKYLVIIISSVIAVATIFIVMANIKNSNNSEKCLETAQMLCPDGIKSYQHRYNFFEGDICKCECS